MSAAHPSPHTSPAVHEDAHGSRAGYLTGFALSVVLTAVPFWLVMEHGPLPPLYTAVMVMAFAAAQILVHMVFFLHMNTKSQGGWIMLALIFTLVFVAVTLIGSMWVMYHLNVNMMPMTAQDMRNAP